MRSKNGNPAVRLPRLSTGRARIVIPEPPRYGRAGGSWQMIRNGIILSEFKPFYPTISAARPNPMGTEGSDSPEPGDCFVVANSRGQCWDGAAWVDGWCGGLQFRRPSPAYELCESAAREAARTTGVAGMVCYIPPGTPAGFVLAPFPDLSQVDLRDFARKPEVC
jgi:hypothetical protein